MRTQRPHSKSFFIYNGSLFNSNITHLLQLYDRQVLYSIAVISCPPFLLTYEVQISLKFDI